MESAPVPIPAYFGAKPDVEVFFQPYSNHGVAQRARVMLTHHLISLVQDGRKEVVVSNRRVSVDASQMLLLSAECSIMSEHGLEGRPMRSLLIFLSSKYLVAFCQRHRIRLDATAVGLQALPQDDFTRHFASGVALLPNAVISANEALTYAKAEEILLYLHAVQPHGLASFLTSALAFQEDLPLRTVVAEHQDSNLTVQEMAFLCHMSLSTFKRHFQAVYGTAPGRYLHARRMERAMVLLTESLRPSEVYFQLGYESLAAFSTEFKKHFGLAPSEVH